MPTGGGKQIEMLKLIKELLQFFATNLRKKNLTLTTPTSAIDCEYNSDLGNLNLHAR